MGKQLNWQCKGCKRFQMATNTTRSNKLEEFAQTPDQDIQASSCFGTPEQEAIAAHVNGQPELRHSLIAVFEVRFGCPRGLGGPTSVPRRTSPLWKAVRLPPDTPAEVRRGAAAHSRCPPSLSLPPASPPAPPRGESPAPPARAAPPSAKAHSCLAAHSRDKNV